MKLKHIACSLCIILLLTGCSLLPSTKQENYAIDNTSHITIGGYLKINHINNNMVLLDNKDTLAADGLYYASFGMGGTKDYENNDGDIIEFYDAQLYLLLGENQDGNEAQNNVDTWLAAGKSNYKVHEEKDISCNEQSYHIIAYDCESKNSPYARGISAFAAVGNYAVCAELTCRDDFTDELETILTDFLNDCSYNLTEEELP